MNIANTNACRKTYLGKPQYNTFADHLVKKIGIAPMDYSQQYLIYIIIHNYVIY